MTENEKVIEMLEEQDEFEEQEDQENNLILKLIKPITFEGKRYEEIDLSGLENVTGGDMRSVTKILTKKGRVTNPATVEMSLDYCQMMAARVAHLPLEFFENLYAKDQIQLKRIVVGFLYDEDGED